MGTVYIKKIQTVIEFYKFTNTLKNTIRQGWKEWKIKKERIESVAEHVYGVQMLALAMHSEFDYKDVDLQKACMMLAIHELGEAVIGDLTEWDIKKSDKVQIERDGVVEILKDLCIKEEILALYDEFEARETPVAKFAF